MLKSPRRHHIFTSDGALSGQKPSRRFDSGNTTSYCFLFVETDYQLLCLVISRELSKVTCGQRVDFMKCFVLGKGGENKFAQIGRRHPVEFETYSGILGAEPTRMGGHRLFVW